LAIAAATGISRAHSKPAPPGRSTISTPANPPAIANQRCLLTRSASMGMDTAAVMMGLTNMMVITVASGSRLSASTMNAALATNSRPRTICPGQDVTRSAPQPVTAITYGTITSSVAAWRRQMTWPTA
jgi:hypothetical protein